MPFVGEDDWFETFEDAGNGDGVLHVEAHGPGLVVSAYRTSGGAATELKLSTADAHKLADLIARKV